MDENKAQCTVCNGIKPKSDFEIDKKTQKFRRRQCKPCRNAKRRAYMNGDPLRDKQLRYLYGIDLKQFRQMHDAQESKCAICLKTNTGGPWRKLLVVDHCHTTGKVRALLCDKCNKGLGQFLDDIEVLQRAVDYLKLHRA